MMFVLFFFFEKLRKSEIKTALFLIILEQPSNERLTEQWKNIGFVDTTITNFFGNYFKKRTKKKEQSFSLLTPTS